MAITDNMYQDLIMNPEFMPNRLQNLEMFPPVDNIPGRLDTSFQEIPGFNFVDAPTSFLSRLQNPQFLDNPRRGIMDATILSKGNPQNSLLNKTMTGITKGIDFGKKVGSGILSAIAGVPFLGNVLTGITSQFENRPLGAEVIDEFGNVYDPEELNKMNALGGYYTDAARSSRRRSKRIAKMLERQKLGKKISLENLAKLQAQEKAQEAAQRAATQSIAAQNRAAGDRGGYQSSFGGDKDFMGGSGTAADMGSFKNGGLAGLL